MKKLLTLAFILATSLLFGQVEISDNSKIAPVKIENDSLKITKTFFDNGNLKKESSINKKNLRGREITYYENGNKHYIEEFIVSELNSNYFQSTKVISAWDENNNQTVIEGNGKYYNTTENKKVTGDIVEGVKNGFWKIVLNDVTYFDYYEKGKFVSGTKKDSNNKITAYKELESKPKFTKGENHFLNYFIQSLKNLNPDDTIIGKMIVEYVVDVNGTITDVKIIKAIDSITNDQVVTLLSRYKDILPGYQRGEPIRVKCRLPISFDMR